MATASYLALHELPFCERCFELPLSELDVFRVPALL